MTLHLIPFVVAVFLLQDPPPPPASPPPAVPHGEAEKSDAAPTLKQEVDALKKQYDDAQQSFNEKYQAAKTDEERSRIYTTDYPKTETYVPRFLELAARAHGGPAAIDCYLWVLERTQDEADRSAAYTGLLADAIANPRLAEAVQSISRYSATAGAERFLRTVIEKSPHWDVKGFATYSLANVLIGLEDLCRRMASPEWSPQNAAANERYYGKETLDDLRTRDPDEIQGEAEDLLEDVASDFKNLKHYQGTLGAAATGDLFELRELQLGKVAPDIEGEDVDGARFKLSDYRGKVVVLDFWGFW